MMDDLVSIIVPVYNCEEHIEKCIESIERQSYERIELLLVNDGSTDNSLYKCNLAKEKYNNIKVYNQENSGVSVARNLGLKYAQGEFVMFVDSDDMIANNMVYSLCSYVENDIDLVCCSYDILGENKEESFFGNDFCSVSLNEKEVFFLQLMDYTYGHSKSNITAIGVPWGKLFRKSLLDNHAIRFAQDLKRMQDNIFVMNAVFYSRKIKYVDKHLYHYRVDHIRTYKNTTYAPDIYLSVLNYRDTFFGDHPEIKSSIIWDYLYKEHLNYLMMSIHYIVVNQDVDKKACSIKQLCNNPIYKNVLTLFPTKSISKKQFVQWILYKLGMYRSLCFLYRLKYSK